MIFCRGQKNSYLHGFCSSTLPKYGEGILPTFAMWSTQIQSLCSHWFNYPLHNLISILPCQVSLFLNMYGLWELANGSVNKTLVALGTGLLPLLFHFLFVNMKFSMLRRKEHLSAGARERLQRHVLRQLEPETTSKTIATSAGDDAANSMERERNNLEGNSSRWVVAQYHLQQIGHQER